MRNPVRPPGGFFNRRLSTRQNSSVDKVSASCTFTFHFHFHYLAFPTLSPFFLLLKSVEMRNKSANRFPFSIFAFAFLLGPRHSLSLTEPANAEQKREYFHFSLSLSLSYFQICFSPCASTQSPRTPNRSASTTDVESHTESDAERGEVTLPALDLFIFTF